MADTLVTEPATAHVGYARLLDAACKLLAIVGGIVLLGLSAMSLWSITGRTLFGKALVGDFELVQMLSAAAVAMSLPYAHWVGAHVIVDFFTAKGRTRGNQVLDLLANLVMAFFAALITWRTAVGLLDLKGNFDASMLLGIPTWYAYAPLVPSFALLALTALHAAAGHLKELRA